MNNTTDTGTQLRQERFETTSIPKMPPGEPAVQFDPTQAKQAKQKPKNPRSRRFYERITAKHALIWLIVCVLACAATVLLIYMPTIQTIRPGDVAKTDIKAPIDIINTAQTEQLKQNALDSVEDVYVVAPAVLEQVSGDASRYLDMLAQMRSEAVRIKNQLIEASDRNSDLRDLPKEDLTAQEWALVMEGNGITSLRLNHFAIGLTDAQVYSILALNQTDFNIWLRDLSIFVQNYLRAGISENNLQDVIAEFIRVALPLTPVTLNSVLQNIATNLLAPTMFFDQEQTDRADELALSNVLPVVIKKDDVMIPKGDVVSQVDYELLRQAGYALELADVLGKYVLIGLFYALLLWCFLVYVALYVPILFRQSIKCVLAVLVTLINLAVCSVLLKISPAYNASFMGALLIAQLVSARAAIAFTVLLVPTLGFASGGASVDFMLLGITAFTTLAGNLSGIYISRNATKRTMRIVAGFISGGAMAVTYAMFATLGNRPFVEIGMNCLIFLLVNTAASVIATGFMPIFETVFNVATPMRLLELANPSHPLLKRLMIEAPGTYHHSMMVATLAENAAIAIDANGMLARTGGYFHDIGKLKRPQYFTENQHDVNPHDALDPLISATIITAHVKDGVALANQHKLPYDVVNCIAQHHGTTTTGALYAKAVQASGDVNTPIQPFRYEGPRPHTKEAAIIMLCDSAEAAVRSIRQPCVQDVEDMINKIVRGKVNEFQLNSSLLSFAEVDAVVKSMNQTLSGSLHERISYPDVDKLKEELYVN